MMLSLAILLSCLGLPNTSLGADELALRPNVGDTFHLVYDQSTRQVTEIEGKSIEMTFEMGMEMDWEVESIDDQGTMSVVMRYTRFRIMMESAEVDDPITFDSASEDRARGYYAESLQKTLEPFLGQDIVIVVTSRGEIESVAIPIETMDAVREAPGSMQVRELLTQEGIVETLSGTLCLLPESELEAGAEWTQSREKQAQNGTLFQEHLYQYNGTEDVDGVSLQQISVDTTLRFEQPEDQVRQPQAIKSHSLEGKIWLDPNTGFFSGSEFRSQIVTETPYADTTIETIADGEYTLRVSLKTD